ncbi:MAG TPA: hypothetical protein VHK26_07015 [Methyloceanibacter sp.]|jgi:hypothetical protein|nr:hypothetical protein [Methyloceanibacter sp.]
MYTAPQAMAPMTVSEMMSFLMFTLPDLRKPLAAKNAAIACHSFPFIDALGLISSELSPHDHARAKSHGRAKSQVPQALRTFHARLQGI